MSRIITAKERASRWKGMGDVIASATKLVGIKPCRGCAKRQESLNKAFPFKAVDQKPK